MTYWAEFQLQNWSNLDYFASSLFYTTGSIAIPLNLILLFVILTSSPTTLRLYIIFLINATLGDLVFAISTTASQIRLIPNKWAFAYVALGPIGWIGGAQGGYFGYCLMLHSLFYMFLCFPISFGFRYWILIRPQPTSLQCVILCFTLWIIALAQHVSFIFSESPIDEIRQYLKQNKPFYNLDHFFISGNHMINSPLTSITLATIVLPMFPIYLLIIYFYKRVHSFLNTNRTQMSSATLSGHRKLMECLTIQASLPLFFMFPPILLYGLYHLEFIHSIVVEYLVYTIFSFLPLFSPIIAFKYIKPYNVALCRLLKLSRFRTVKPLYQNYSSRISFH